METFVRWKHRIFNALLVGTLGAGVLWLCFLQPGEAQIGAPNQVLCNNVPQQPVADIATGNTVKLVTEVTGKAVYVCGWHVTAGAASTFKFSFGTGSGCATGNTQLTPTFNVSTSAPSQDHIEFAGISVPTGNAVCVTVAGTGPAQVMLWFGQY